MRFSIVLSVTGLVSSALAAASGCPTSDITVYTKAFDTIRKYVTKLDDDIKKINSTDLNILLPLDGDARDISQAVINQTALVKKAPNIAQGSVLAVAGEAQSLIDFILATLLDLHQISQYVFGSSTQGIVVADVTTIKGNANDFINALKPKAPSNAQFIVTADKRQLDKAFRSILRLYNRTMDST